MPAKYGGVSPPPLPPPPQSVLLFLFLLWRNESRCFFHFHRLTPLRTLLDPVLRGPRAEAGAGHHGTGAAGERAGHLPPGCHALPARLLSGQDGRWVVGQTRGRGLSLKNAIEQTHNTHNSIRFLFTQVEETSALKHNIIIMI